MGANVIFQKNGCKLCALRALDGATQRVSLMVFQVDSSGNTSTPLTFQRSDILQSCKKLNVLLDFSISMDTDELKQVTESLKKVLNGTETIRLDSDKATPVGVYRAICKKFADEKEESEKLSGGVKVPKPVFVRKQKICIRTTEFERILKLVEETQGYSKLEILRMLKIMGVLDVDEDRPYDKKVTVSGRSLRFYCIQMPDELGGHGI